MSTAMLGVVRVLRHRWPPLKIVDVFLPPDCRAARRISHRCVAEMQVPSGHVNQVPSGHVNVAPTIFASFSHAAPPSR